MIPFTTVAGVTSFVWPLATTQKSLIAVSVVYGYAFLLSPPQIAHMRYYSFAYGGYISLLVAPVFAMGEVSNVGQRSGMFLTVSTLGMLTGPPISGAINRSTGDVKEMGYYAGNLLFIPILMILESDK